MIAKSAGRTALLSAASSSLGMALCAAAAAIYWQSARFFDAGRPDFFYLGDAFLHGRTWLTQAFGPWDVVAVGTRIYVPFAPFPAIALAPLVALVGPRTATEWQPAINAVIAAADVGLVWWLAARIGVRSFVDRFWLALLLGFSTPIWWVATRGGVWHTGQLIATFLTLAALIETWGKRRPLLLGLLVGAAFLTRAPLAFAAPFFGWVLIDGSSRGSAVRRLLNLGDWPWRNLLVYAMGVLPSVVFFFWYNDVRFGSPLVSGYGEASLPDWLARQRDLGLFSLAHVPMNVDYLFLKVPRVITQFPWFKPDGLGMSIFLTSPGLLLALRADWTKPRVVGLGLTAIAVLIPSLLYYGGGWLQYGYRYALDSIPFVLAICAVAASRRRIGWGWRVLILFGVLVGLGGVYWAYNLR